MPVADGWMQVRECAHAGTVHEKEVHHFPMVRQHRRGISLRVAYGIEDSQLEDRSAGHVFDGGACWQRPIDGMIVRKIHRRPPARTTKNDERDDRQREEGSKTRATASQRVKRLI